MNIDNAKENIQPLAGGRNISLLEVALNAESQEAAHTELMQKRCEFEKLIEEYCGVDPLEKWYEYILWIEQCYPKSGKQSAFDAVLGKCITALENDERYHQDRRMIRIYIKYIDFLQNPHEHFNTLYNQGIGTMVSDLYICWAYYFEIMENFERAENIYQLGFDARAQPIENLLQAHEQFLLSVGQRTLYRDEKMRQTFLSTMEERRSALTSLRGHQTQEIGSIRTGAVVKENIPGCIDQKISNSVVISSSEIPIYVDEHDASVGRHRSTADNGIRSIVDNPKKQENQWEPGPWSKTKKRTQSGALFPMTGRIDSKLDFDILEDSNEWDGNVHIPSNFANQNFSQTNWKVHVATYEDHPAGVFPQYDKFCCYPTGINTCYSPEELRAYKWYKQHQRKSNILTDLDKIVECNFQKGTILPEYFRQSNELQEPFHVEKCKIESLSNQKLMCRLETMNLVSEREEMSFEELLAVRFRHRYQTRVMFSNTEFLTPQSLLRNSNVNESCSTQTFNYFIKPQLVSTPKTDIKKSILTPRSSLPFEHSQVCVSAETINQPELSTPETEDANIATSKRLSTILEITEPSANTGSSGINRKSSSTSSEDAIERGSHTLGQKAKKNSSTVVASSHFHRRHEPKTVQNNSSRLFYNEDVSNPIVIYEDTSENILAPPRREEYIAYDFAGFTQSPPKQNKRIKLSSIEYNDSLTPSCIREVTVSRTASTIPKQVKGESMKETSKIDRNSNNGKIKFESENESCMLEPIFHDSCSGASHLNGESMRKFATAQSSTISLAKQDNYMIADPDKHTRLDSMSRISSCLPSIPKLPKIVHSFGDQERQAEYIEKKLPIYEGSTSTVNTSFTFPPTNKHEMTKKNIFEKTDEMELGNQDHNASHTISYWDEIWLADAKERNIKKLTLQESSDEKNALIVSHMSENDPLRMKITMVDKSKNFSMGCKAQSPPFNKSTKILMKDSPSSSLNGSDTGQSIYMQINNSLNGGMNHDEEWSEDDNQPLSSYQRKEIDMNETQQVIDDNLNLAVVNPFNPKLINAFLEKADFMNFLENLDTCTLTHNVKMLKPNTVLEMNSFSMDVGKLLGSGTFGKVYQAKCRQTGKSYALKQERPANLWEYYILLELKYRMHEMNKSLMSAFADVEFAIIGNNASILALPFCRYGTLVNVCNVHKFSTEKNLHEYIVIVLATQILSIIDHLHACNIIHADIKPDNFMLTTKLNYDSPYSALKLIDFGQSIDMKHFPENTTFKYVVKTEGFTCTEMMENKPWSYQTDLFGVAATIHVLLFGKYMNVEKNFRGWVMTTKLPRYFQKTMWERIFTTLLNVRDCQSMPNLQDIKFMLQTELSMKEQAVRDQIVKFNSVLDNYKPGS